MIPTVETPIETTQVVRYSVTDAEIAKLREQYADLQIATAGYEAVRLAIADLRGLRTAVERRRVDLKADALAWGRKVDAEAKRITGLLSAIEDPLQRQKDAVDAEKERVRREAAEAKQRELEAKLRAEREAEEAKLREAREAEERRLAEIRAQVEAERQALAQARRQQEEADAARRAEERRQHELAEAKLRAERDALEAERRRVQEAREQAEREEFERQAKIRAEQEAAERIERERIAKLAREAELQALLPDLEKVKAFAAAVRAVPVPKVKARKVAALLSEAQTALVQIATDLEAKAGAL